MSNEIPEYIPPAVRGWIETLRDPRVSMTTRENYANNLNALKVFLEKELKSFDTSKKFKK